MPSPQLTPTPTPTTPSPTPTPTSSTPSPTPSPTPVSGGGGTVSFPTAVPTPVPTPTPTIPSGSITIGDTVKTTAAISIRSTAAGTRLGSQPSGAQGKIISGPSTAQGRKWWKVDYFSSSDGWSAEDYLVKAIPATTQSGTPNLTRDLRYGMSGLDVTVLQNYLILKGYLAAGNNSGYFGNATFRAVQAFQKAKGISSTGYVGTQTRAVVNSGI